MVFGHSVFGIRPFSIGIRPNGFWPISVTAFRPNNLTPSEYGYVLTNQDVNTIYYRPQVNTSPKSVMNVEKKDAAILWKTANLLVSGYKNFFF